MNSIAEPILNLYSPQRQSKRQLLDEFIDRKGIRERILGILRHNTPDKPQQHVVLIGPRGMGKTTLLCAIRYSVEEDAELGAAWLPLQFYEEQYNIGDLADFWLECLRHLEQALNRRPETADRLLDENPADLAERAQAQFFEMLAGTGKRALLLVDNLQEIFAAIDDGHALHKLRALWMTDPRMTVIGAAPSYFEEITAVDQAFHDFFRSFVLERLSQGEMETCLRRYAEILGDKTVPEVIEKEPERVAALRILTGGNPRLVKLGYRVLRDGLDGDLRNDLERLLDEATPFFKHRIDSLAKEARRAFDAIAKRWDPVTVDDIRRELRKPSNYVSVQIKRLIEEGFVEEVSGDKKKLYQVSERFYNVYYLWRLSREGRRKLRWLVGFMKLFYEPKDYKDFACRLEKDLEGDIGEALRAEKLAHLHALCAAADGDARDDVFEVLVRDAIARNDRRALDEEATDNDPIETHGYRYLAAEVIWLLSPEARRHLGFMSRDANWWNSLRQELLNANLLDATDSFINDLGGWKTNTVRHARVAGLFHARLFRRPKAAEAAYRKALKLEPNYVGALNGLGNVLYEQSRDAESETVFREALELDPEYKYPYVGLGNILLDQGLNKQAESLFRRALDIDQDYAEAWNNLGVTLAAQRRYVEAETAYREALKHNSRDVVGLNNLGNALCFQGRYAEAEASYYKILKIDPTYSEVWNGIAYMFERQGRYLDAESAYQKALELEPEFEYAHINLSGLFLLKLNQIDNGISELLKGLELMPEDNFARWLLIQFWQPALPPAVAKIAANDPGADNLRSVLTEVLLEKAATGERTAVRDALLALDDTGQAIFEPLLLALRALDDRAILQRIAREKRDLVLDVMKRIEGQGENESA